MQTGDDIYPRSSWLHRLVFWVMCIVLRQKLKTHVRAVAGIRNAPRAGPMILVANHESYFDTFAICALFHELFGRRVWVPTKVKAFKGRLRRLFHEAGGAIAVDHADPADAYRKIGGLLERGECVLVFPEGQRSEGNGLLPFRYGGFNMAVKLGADVVPLALHGTARALPKGRLTFVRGEQAFVEIGAPLAPSQYAAPGDEDPAVVAQRMCAAAREWIEGRLADSTPRPTPADATADALALAKVMEERVERLLDDGIESITSRQAATVRDGCRVGFALGLRSEALEVQHARVYGFWVLGLPRLVAFLFLRAYVALVQSGLARQADQPYLHYCMGQYYSRAPALLGGSRVDAATSLARAYEGAPSYGLDPAKFVVSYASSLALLGRDADAVALLMQHFASGPGPHPTRREVRRHERARALVARLRDASGSLQRQTT